MIIDVMDLLRGVKAWRDSDGNEGFPDEIRARIEIVLASDAAMAVAENDSKLDKQQDRIEGFRARHAMRETQREQTAATFLAALIQAHAIINAERHQGHNMDGADYVAKAVEMTDALRAELGKERP